MKNAWIVGGIILTVYIASILGLTYYFTIPSQTEKQSVQVLGKPINSSPVSDELASELKAKEKYGEWPIKIEESRLGKDNPFRF